MERTVFQAIDPDASSWAPRGPDSASASVGRPAAARWFRRSAKSQSVYSRDATSSRELDPLAGDRDRRLGPS